MHENDSKITYAQEKQSFAFVISDQSGPIMTKDLAGQLAAGGALIGGAQGFLPTTVDEFYALLPAQVRKLLP